MKKGGNDRITIGYDPLIEKGEKIISENNIALVKIAFDFFIFF